MTIGSRFFEFMELFLTRLPPNWAAAFDFYFHPGLRHQWGGAFNGQRGRREIFADLLKMCGFQAVVETGSYRGGTTEFIYRQSSVLTYSVECELRSYHYAARRLKKYDSVHLSLGNSRSFLEKLSRDPTVPKQNVFFYLDAHWYDHLPLRQELEIIFRHWTESVVMIDDFQVPGDPGYGFDDYGAGECLCLDYLAPLAHHKWEAFFPSVSSQNETGRRRGCVVLANSPITKDSLQHLQTLRQAS